jgi:hypothetical protein
MNDGYGSDGPEGFGNHEFDDFNGLDFTHLSPKKNPEGQDAQEQDDLEPERFHDDELRTHGVMHYDNAGGWIPGPSPEAEEFQTEENAPADGIYSNTTDGSASIALNGEGDTVLIGSVVRNAPDKTVMAVFNTHEDSTSFQESKASALIPITDEGSTGHIIDSIKTDFDTPVFDENTTVVVFTNSEEPVSELVLEKLYDSGTTDVRRINTSSEMEIYLNPGQDLTAYVDDQEFYAYPNEGETPSYSPSEILLTPGMAETLTDTLNDNRANWLVTRNPDSSGDYRITASVNNSEDATELILSLDKGAAENYYLSARIIDDTTIEATSLPAKRYSEDDAVKIPESMLAALTELSAQAGYMEVRLARPTDLDGITSYDEGYDELIEIIGSNDGLEMQNYLEELYNYVALDSGFKEKGRGWGRLTPKR